jgi:hypothetical protein
VEIKPIRSDADHQAALKEIAELMESLPGTPDADRMDVLVTLVEAYEAKHYPIPVPDDFPSGLSNPARRALAAAGISRLEQFTKISEKELLQLHGLGPKTIRTITEAMSERGLTFASVDSSRSISTQANQKITRRAPKQYRKIAKP